MKNEQCLMNKKENKDMRIKIGDDVVVEASELQVKEHCEGCCNCCDAVNEDQRVYLEATLIVSPHEWEQYKSECQEGAEDGDLRDRCVLRFCFRKSEFGSYEEALAEAYTKLDEALQRGWTDLSNIW